MCGIAGILDPRGVGSDEVERMAQTLAHRGPDDAAVHVEPGVGFGFRRLAVIDLATGRQPIANEDETVWVMLNGEIYDYRAIRAALLARGHRFRSRSDAEVLVHLYEERGADLVNELRGMFAFALWDRRRRRLLLARDHLGQKPLFWAQQGRRVYFASELKAILAVAPEFRAVDPAALHEYLTIRVIPDPRSMFAGIKKLPPAHVLEIGTSGPKLRRYWQLRYEPKRAVSEDYALAELDQLLRETVRLHLESDVPVGAFLSGGIDSALVVAFMRTVDLASFKTFSVGVPYGQFNEAPTARLMAERYGTQHYEDTIDGNVVASLPRVVYHLDEPSDPLSVCMYHLARMTRQEVKVVLGGDGGDELFGGYDRYYGVRYARYYALLPRAVRERVVGRVLDHAPDGFWYKSLTHRLRWLHELARVDGPRRYARSLSYFYFTPHHRRTLYSEWFGARVAEHDAEASLMAWQDGDGVKETLDRMLLADSVVRLPNHPVMILDRMAMAHGLEARSPYLDHRLAEYAATLPVGLKVRGRRRRYLQMRLAERYLPREVLRRPKQGFNSGLPYMMRTQFDRLFAHYVTQSARLVQAGFLQHGAIDEMLTAHLGGQMDHGNRLWLLLNAELWYRMHIEGVSASALEDEVREVLAGGAGTAPVAVAPAAGGGARVSA